jgi:thymidylate synthase
MFTSMRSNDAFIGLPHDFFAFTMIHEIVARDLAVELGAYKHAVGSLHLYDGDQEAARRFLDEGWQPTNMTMPPMPSGDPWPSIKLLRIAEAAIRAGERIDPEELKDLDPYWADLIRLLEVFRLSRDKDCDGIIEVRDKMSSSIYGPFIEQRISECHKRVARERVKND